MNKLINFEFRKLLSSKSFYICSLITLAMVLLNIFTTNMLLDSGVSPASKNLSGLSSLKNALSSGMVLMISGIFTALFVCEDESSGTLKNIYARGYSRSTVYFAKYFVSLFSVIIFSLICMIGATICATIFWGNNGTSGENYVFSIIEQILIVIVFHAIYFVISIILGKVGSSIAINIVAPSIINLILTMFDAIFKTDNFKLSSYWLDSLLTKLQGFDVSDKLLVTALILPIVYLAITLIIGYFLNQRKEV